MNLSTEQVNVAGDEVATATQPHRVSRSCDEHPEERFSGFCPTCLCERLSVLDQNGAPSSSNSRKPSPSISTAGLKAIFKPSSGNNKGNGNGGVRGGFFPELGRSKSGLSGGFEAQRRSCSGSEEKRREIVEEKRMKEYMDLYPQEKKPSLRSFFTAASVFSKKLQKWRHKKITKPVQKPTSRRQPEVAARRSSDTDPRFSLDIGRISVDEPRASWDGHLIGRASSMLSVLENAPPMHPSDMLHVEDHGGPPDSHHYRKGVVSIDDDEEEDRYSRSNSTGVVERSLSESCPQLVGGPKMRRSNSNVSWRSSWRNSSKDGGDNGGMLRFYLTPSWRNGAGGSGWEKTAARANSHGHSIARRVMRLY